MEEASVSLCLKTQQQWLKLLKCQALLSKAKRLCANKPNLESQAAVEASAEEAEVEVVSEGVVVVTEVTEEAAAASLVEEEVTVALAVTAMEGAEEEAVVEVGTGIAEDHPVIEMTAETLADQAAGEVTTMVVITGTTDFEFNTPEYLNIGMHL